MDTSKQSLCGNSTETFINKIIINIKLNYTLPIPIIVTSSPTANCHDT